MKIKLAARYQMREFVHAGAIYYLVITLLYLAVAIVRWLITDTNVNVSGTETSTFIFLFVMGLNAFKSPLRLFLQNGLSRRTLLCGFLVTAAAASVVTALIDNLIPLIFSSILGYQPLYTALYPRNAWVGIPWTILAFFVATCAGFFLSAMYYRMNKWLKLLVSIGVPSLVFVVLPIVEAVGPGIRPFTFLGQCFLWVLGISGTSANPWQSIGALCGIGALIVGLSYLLIRRATLKDA